MLGVAEWFGIESDLGAESVDWLKFRNHWIVAGVMVFLPGFLPVLAEGQTRMGSVTMKAGVSETVALSLSPNLPQDNLRIDAHGDVKTLTLTLSGSAAAVVAVRVPILIRSNIGYKISALVQSEAATLTNFAVLDVRPTGRFVATDAVASLNVARELDDRTMNGTVRTASLPLSLSSSFPILSGPRVSLAGTLDSADNALEVTILITVKPDAGANSWLLRLTLAGSAGDRF